MKILHIVSGDLEEGAARGALNLHLSLLEKGVKSAILVDGVLGKSLSDLKKNRSMIKKYKAKLFRRFNHIPTSIYRSREKQKFTNIVSGNKLSKDKRIKEFDILHFHWVDGAAFDHKDLEAIPQPIVWTLRDMWPFTGGCHYTYECKKYSDSCGHCPQLSSNRIIDLSSRNIIAKKSVKKPIKYVAVSQWLKERALESAIMNNEDIDVIHNGVDTRVYYPKKEENIRKRLNIQQNKLIVLVGALDLSDKYKGLDLLVQALNLTEKNFVVLSFGKTPIMNKFKNDLQIYDLGYFNDPHELSKIYNTADVFVSASISEAFGKTVAESLACGTPVVCFSETGSAEVVIDGETGAIAKNSDIQSLADCITSELNSGKSNKKMQDCQNSILRDFQSTEVASKYLKIYNEVTVQN